ncbi:Uncharacterized protein OS=uncultured bacterium GN=ACD_48C00479G0005 PE=4 SV=1 [Gemmata massiliana]|uniref:Uncharacterized protein n=1 Tax=Gemmata massiliana TaxID=1210884 RepID=A0A6P2DI47_9BACT|nr:hypothetical protein [Gemmata massiliana]VTS01845.1 Uncharacterized protein OS=uncultured bacterium GN=ACD_48C00479G0005 PE=4 SV=1 [Gemmata massiliana]
MGGFGSGQRWTKKVCVEGCTALDTSELKRMGLLVPRPAARNGTLRWYRKGASEPSSAVGYTIVVGETGGVLRLDYQMTRSREKLDYAVELVATTCHLGGRRWWFICPLTRNGMTCTRRVRKLYLCGSYFGCRYCHDLTYTSRQESDGRVYAALRRGPHHDFGDIRGMSVSQLGLTLKVLTAEQKRLDRLGKRLDRFTARRTKGQ